MELIHQFAGFLNMDNSVEEAELGEDYPYALNVVKNSNVANDNKVESVVGSIAVSTSTYLDNNSYCIGVIQAPKDDIGYLFFYNTVATKNCILQLAPSLATYSIVGVNTISGNTTITYTANTNILVGDTITGSGISQYVIVVAVQSNTSCVISQPATATISGGTLSGSRTSDTISLILQYSGLAFGNTKPNRVTGFALGSLLYFTDNLTEPKCVHLTRYSGGSTPTNIEEIYMLKRGPRYAPYTDYVVGQGTGYGWGKGQDGTGIYNNNIYQDVQFAVQYQYTDGQLSVLSPYSVMIRKLKDSELYNYIRIRLTQDQFSLGSITITSGSNIVTCASTTGLYPGMYVDDQSGYTIIPYLTRIASITDATHFTLTNNSLATLGSIAFTFRNMVDTIPYLVTQINLFARIGQTGTFAQVGQITRTLGGSFATNFIDYKGANIGNILDAHYLQQFENLPQQIGTLTAAASRSWIGNYTEGYAKYLTSNITYGGVNIYSYLSSFTTPGFSTFSEISQYKVGFILRDVNLRVMGVVTAPNYSFSVPTFSTGQPTIYIAELMATTLASLPAWVYDVGIVMTKDTNKSFFLKDIARNAQWVSLTSVITMGVATTVQNFSLTYPIGGVAQSPTLTTNTSTGMAVGSTYNGIAPTSTSGSGTGALFTFVTSSATTFTSCVATTTGKGYAIGDTVTFNGSLFGGAGSSIWTITAITNGAKYLAVDASSFANAGKYYTWQTGDRFNGYLQSVLGGGTYTQDLAIEAFDGTYLYLNPSSLLAQNLGVTLLNSAALSLEAIIYRPIIDASAVNNLFYEVPNESWIATAIAQGSITGSGGLTGYSWGSYFLNNGGTCNIPNTILEGDCMLGFSSYQYAVGPPALNLVLQQMTLRGNNTWNTPSGRPFVQTKVDLAQKTTWARYGGTFISGTSINQLAEFTGSSEQNISPNAGTLQKLQPTVRDSSQSAAILAICNTDTYSIYINEAIITTGNANAIVASSVNIIGDVRQQQSGYGTLHPESVVMDNYGGVYWFDTLQRSYVHYTNNGISAISFKKMSGYFYYQSLANQATDLVLSAYDPYYEMIYVCFTNVHGGGPINGNSTMKTIGYSIMNERWQGFYSVSFNNGGPGFFSGSKNMYSVYNNGAGFLWKHTPFSPYASIQGNQQNCSVSLSLVPKYDHTSNSPGSHISEARTEARTSLHEWKVLKMQVSPGFFSWSAGLQFVNDPVLKAIITNKNGQLATLLNNRPSGEQEFEAEENVIYSVLKFDENSVNKLTGVVDSSSCLYGDPLTSNTLQVNFIWSGIVYSYFRTVAIGYEPTRGHDV